MRCRNSKGTLRSGLKLIGGCRLLRELHLHGIEERRPVDRLGLVRLVHNLHVVLRLEVEGGAALICPLPQVEVFRSKQSRL